MEHNFACIIQARNSSSRLPGKIMLPFYNAQTILDIQLQNIHEAFPGSIIILATTVNKADDVIAAKYENYTGIKVFRGDENNVLKRFIDAANENSIEHILRICSDNPFLSMSYCKPMIGQYFKLLPDYISYGFSNGTPSIRSHCGLFAEMVSLNALNKVRSLTHEALFMEHVTNYIYSNPDKFTIEYISVPESIDAYVYKLRLTIDTKQDFANLQKLYIALITKYGKGFTVEQLLSEVEKSEGLLNEMTEQIRQHAK